MSTTTQATPMDTVPVDARTAAAIEAAEARAWADLYAAAPLAWAQAVGHGAREIGGALVLHWRATGRRYFSRAIGLGVTAPASEQALDAILACWEELGIDAFLVQSLPHCAPAEYERWLRVRGLEPFDAQDRIVRGGQPASALPAAIGDRELAVERVEPASAGEWSDFLQRVYGLDTGSWLPRLIGRPGWHQYVAREDGAIVAARGMFIGSDGWAWLGMDGPVPGLMTQDYAPDAALCAVMVEDGLAHGARGFLTDVEAPSATQDTPAYGAFAALGFTRPYVRTHWTRVVDGAHVQAATAA
ncbi:MAG TPA: hypothetical protein VN635_04625 [Conexibacter sp.]|nr:hypothetical protein [Conexibacter sp.]